MSQVTEKLRAEVLQITGIPALAKILSKVCPRTLALMTNSFKVFY